MAKNITLTEAQFRDLLKTKLNENSGDQFLDYDSTINLLYAVIQNDFKIYFGQKDYVCNSLNDKGEVLEAICNSSYQPSISENGRIKLFNQKYGFFEIDNLL